MRVQLQEQSGPDTIHHHSVPLVATVGVGWVTVAQIVAALQQLRAHPAIPGALGALADSALARAIAWAQARPPAGVAAMRPKSFYFDVQNPGHSLRFDIENIVGHNLRS